MYEPLLALHSVLRWIVLGAGLAAVLSAAGGWSGRRPWSRQAERWSRIFPIAFDAQVVAGLVLYLAVSPISTVAFRDVGAAMGDSIARFWLVEHTFGMLVALALAHVGRSRVRRAAGDRTRARRATVFFGLALLVAVLTTPWPFLPYGRPLWPWP